MPRQRWKIFIYGMFDMHLFYKIPGNTPQEITFNWRTYNRTRPHRAIIGKREIDDLGEMYLCPAILSYDNKEKRKIGPMVFFSSDPEGIAEQAWCEAIQADKYAMQALAARGYCLKIQKQWNRLING